MPPDPTSPRRPVVDVSRRGRVLLPTIVVLGVLVIAFLIFTNFYTEWLWFQSVKFTKVFATQFWTKVALFAIFGLLMAAIVAVNVVIAYRVRPPFRGLSLEQQSLDRYRVAIDPHRRKIVIAAAILLGLLAGGSASGEWRQFLLWRNGVAFGRKDPQFGKDIGFFAFDLPFLRF